MAESSPESRFALVARRYLIGGLVTALVSVFGVGRSMKPTDLGEQWKVFVLLGRELLVGPTDLSF